MNNKPDFFKNSARDWDKFSLRVNNARKIAEAIRENISLDSAFHVLDFGAGTGLLSEGIAPFVSRITAMDYSQAMLDKFLEKDWVCEIDVLHIDLLKATLDHVFDGIISSMTLHHIDDIDLLFKKFNGLLDKGGFIALADLESEDGSFHSNNKEAGVIHFGFDESYIRTRLQQNGFENIRFHHVHNMEKKVNDQWRAYPVFLVTAYKW